MRKLLIELVDLLISSSAVRVVLRLALRIMSPVAWLVLGVMLSALLAAWYLRRTRLRS